MEKLTRRDLHLRIMGCKKLYTLVYSLAISGLCHHGGLGLRKARLATPDTIPPYPRYLSHIYPFPSHISLPTWIKILAPAGRDMYHGQLQIPETTM